MPHIIVEYPATLANDSQVEQWLNTLHHAIADSGLFKANQIKTRAYAFQQYTHAGSDAPYIHIQARIKSGRDSDNKKQLAQTITQAMSKLDIPNTVITAEVIDMHRESYSKA